MKDKQEIILRREGDIGQLEINNPPQNYLERPDFIDISNLSDFMGTGIKALVICGTGRNFSAGANIESIEKQIKNINVFKDQMVKGNRLLNYIDELDIPVIAAISGVCFGAGLEIALACDIRYCDSMALFAFPEVNHDLFPGLGGYRRLIKLTGKSTALELVLKGDMINAEKAFELKIVDDIVEKKQALEHSILKAQKITYNKPLKVINAIMKSINNAEKLGDEDVIKEDAILFTKLALEVFGDREH